MWPKTPPVKFLRTSHGRRAPRASRPRALIRPLKILGNASDVWPKLRSLLRLSPTMHPQNLLAEETIMAETTGTSGQRRPASSGQGSAGAKFDEAAASTKRLADLALLAGQDLTEKAKDLAGNSADAIKARASDFADAAKDVASQATDKLKSAVNDRKSSGAEYVGTLADTMRRAARA